MRILSVVPSRGSRASKNGYDGSLKNKKSSMQSLARQQGKNPTLILHPSVGSEREPEEGRYHEDEDEEEMTARHGNRSRRDDPDDIIDHEDPEYIPSSRRPKSGKKRIVQVVEPNSLSLERPRSEKIFREHKEAKKDDSRGRPSSARSLPVASRGSKGKWRRFPKERWMSQPDEVDQNDSISDSSSTDEYLKTCEKWGKYKVDRHSLVESKLVSPDAGGEGRMKPETRSYSDLGVAVWRDSDEEEDSEPDWDSTKSRSLDVAVLSTNPYDDATLTSLEMVDYDAGKAQVLTEDQRFDYTAHAHADDSDEDSSEETDPRFERERQRRKRKWIKNGKRAQQGSSKTIPKKLPGKKPKKVVVHDNSSTSTVSSMSASIAAGKGRAVGKVKKKEHRLAAVDEDYDEDAPVATKKKKSLSAYRKKSIADSSSEEDAPVAAKKKSRDAFRKKSILSSDEDIPEVSAKRKSRDARRKKASRQEDSSTNEDVQVPTKKKNGKKTDSIQEDSSSDEDVFVAFKKKAKKKRDAFRKKAKSSRHEASSSDEDESEGESGSESESERKSQSETQTQSESESKSESKSENVDESEYDDDNYSEYDSDSSGSLSLRAQNEFRMRKREEHQRWLEERDRRTAAMLNDDCSTSESYIDDWDDYEREERLKAKRAIKPKRAKSRCSSDNSASSNRLRPSQSTQSTQTSIEESNKEVYPRPSRSTQTSVAEFGHVEEKTIQESSGKAGLFGRLRRAILHKGAKREATEQEGENAFEAEMPDEPAQEPLPWEVEEPDPNKNNRGKRIGRPSKEAAAVRSVDDLPFPGSDSMDESLLEMDDKYKDMLDQLPQLALSQNPEQAQGAASVASASVTLPDKKRPALWRAKKGLGNKLKSLFK